MYKTMEQIKEEYDGYWVYMMNCKKGEYHAVLGGEVVLSSKRRDELFRAIPTLARVEGNTYIKYVGDAPEGLILWL